MDNHLQKTKVGVIWSFFNQGGSQILNLLVTFILARLITPAEFGLIGMIAVFTGFAKIFVDFGFSNALIQKSKINQQDINTVFSFNLITGALLSILFFVFAFLIADFYEEPLLEKITQIYAPIFFISAIGGVNQALMVKSLDFKLNTVISLITVIISSITAIIMGLYGFGVWSILTKMILEQLLITLFVMIYYPVNQRPVFNLSSFKSLSKNGFNMAGDSIINYWSRNADNLIIGKYLGDGPLGIYTKSYGIMMLPLRNLSRVIGKVMFPSFSILQNDISQIRSIYLKATSVIAYITFPIMIGLSILAKPFVLIAFGPNWTAMIPIITILSGIGALQSVFTLNGVIFNSLGKPEISLRITIIRIIVNIAAFIIGVSMGGLIGLALAYAIVTLLSIIPTFYLAGKQINVSIGRMAKNLSRSFFATVIMGIAVYFVYSYISEAGLGSFFQLIIPALIGGLIYFLIGFLLKFEEFNIARNLLKRNKNK